jgi:hypothetical protein
MYLFIYGLWFIFIIIYLFPQEYFRKKNAEDMPTKRDYVQLEKRYIFRI